MYEANATFNYGTYEAAVSAAKKWAAQAARSSNPKRREAATRIIAGPFDPDSGLAFAGMLQAEGNGRFTVEDGQFTYGLPR